MKEQFKASAERGQGMIDYALILSLIAVVAVITLSIAGTTIRGVFSNVVNGLQSNVPQYGSDEENQDQGNQDQQNENPGNEDPGNESQEDEHEGEQCQVHQSSHGRTTYYLFTMRSGEWRYENQSRYSFHVAECPPGTME
jgi:pilus assembly protein Flp/PilA